PHEGPRLPHLFPEPRIRQGTSCHKMKDDRWFFVCSELVTLVEHGRCCGEGSAGHERPLIALKPGEPPKAIGSERRLLRGRLAFRSLATHTETIKPAILDRGLR